MVGSVLIGQAAAIVITTKYPSGITTSNPWAVAGGLWVVASAFALWGLLFYHWGTHQFESLSTKKRWFWVLLIGTVCYFLGPLWYYVQVFERGKGMGGDI
jgi:hypothetical protein